MGRQHKRAIAVLFIGLWTTTASGTDIPVGCAAPSARADHRTYFVDPLRGSMTNDGSAERPWRTLAEVFSNKLINSKAFSSKYPSGDRTLSIVNPDGRIKPGDTILLMSGNHGTPILQGYVNDEFITVMAAPQQTPVVSGMKINGSSRWMFGGIKFEGPKTSTEAVNGLIEISRSNWAGPADNIIFINNSVSTEDNVAGWSESDWVNKPFYYGLLSYGTCVTVSQNRFYHLRNAIAISGDRMLVEDNVIEDFGNDGLNVTASQLTIRRNIIRNAHHFAAETLHSDGIQGWNINGKANKDVFIDSNIVINVGDPKVNAMQGISIFDGKWEGLTIQNNVVVTNHWHAITLYGVVNALVINNTVVPSDPIKFPSWIRIQNGKDGSPSQNVVIRNNITTSLVYSGINVIADHNVASKSIQLGSGQAFEKPGFVADNRIDEGIYRTLTKIDHTKKAYDLRPRPGTLAVGAGSKDRAPAFDVTGKPRTAPVDIGAYVH